MNHKFSAPRKADKFKAWMAAQIVTCEAKTGFPSLRKAYASAAAHSVKVHPYECSVCGEYHLTSKEW
jgi:hypothetical protein